MNYYKDKPHPQLFFIPPPNLYEMPEADRLLQLSDGGVVEIKTGEIYDAELGDLLSFSFQEQWEPPLGVHTHIWIWVKDDDTLEQTQVLFNLLLEAQSYPEGLHLIGFNLICPMSDGRPDTENYNSQVELVIKRPLSRRLMEEIFDWIIDVVEEASEPKS